MLLVASSTSQVVWPLKITCLLKMEEMHHWKLSEEEERREESSTYWEYNGLCGLAMDGRKRKGGGSAKSKHSPFMSSQLAASMEGLCPQSRLQRKKLVFFWGSEILTPWLLPCGVLPSWSKITNKQVTAWSFRTVYAEAFLFWFNVHVLFYNQRHLAVDLLKFGPYDKILLELPFQFLTIHTINL